MLELSQTFRRVNLIAICVNYLILLDIRAEIASELESILYATALCSMPLCIAYNIVTFVLQSWIIDETLRLIAVARECVAQCKIEKHGKIIAACPT